MSTLIDLSSNKDLAPLAAVMASIGPIASALDIRLFLMGAAARDLWLTHVYGRPVRRATRDVDFGVMVTDWGNFEALRNELLETGQFKVDSGVARHKLKHSSGLPLDVVPYGGVERADRTIAWPPEESTVYDCFGMSEAYATCSTIRLPGSVDIQVPSIAALALLKIQAWQDRKRLYPGRDAQDLLDYARHYLDCGNFEYASQHHADIFDAEEFDTEYASAQLLGRGIASLLDDDATRRIGSVLAAEADEHGTLLLARQSNLDIDRARRLIAALAERFEQRFR